MKLTTTKDIRYDRFVALIVGESGNGKTTLAHTLPHDQTLIVSAENGLLALKKHNVEIDVAEIDPENTYGSITEVFEYLDKPETRKKYKYLFIDSLSEISELILAELKRDPKLNDAKNAFPLWNKYSERMTIITKCFRDYLGYSVIFTCQNCFEKDGVALKETFNISGTGFVNSLKGMFDIILSYRVYPNEDKDGEPIRKLVSCPVEAPLSKDRSGLLDKYEDVDLSTLINKVLGGTNG